MIIGLVFSDIADKIAPSTRVAVVPYRVEEFHLPMVKKTLERRLLRPFNGLPSARLTVRLGEGCRETCISLLNLRGKQLPRLLPESGLIKKGVNECIRERGSLRAAHRPKWLLRNRQ